ncbi:MAG TPA: serine/threonine-protein kinase [Thermoanaerobaculia bacterium]|nr:serine/threonine-protein kinase [Thermoanaerobaculia bacterium]
MRAETWGRLKALFHHALELAEGQREAFLAAECAGDEALAAALRALLASHDRAEGFLDQNLLEADPELAEELSSAALGSRLGPYRIDSELGRGGMGAVYLAHRDDQTYEQAVAIKLIKRGMDTEEIVRRFVAERQILARLTHPFIARLLDGGATLDGRPYVVMERIEGRPLMSFCEERRLGVAERLRLFLRLAEAVHFAHQNLVVHRDLKPANVLVEADGTPKLLDFGIAKLLEPAAPGLTRAEANPRTPEYASPEQLAGGVVTTATDVYGLGLLLYELLAGVNPKTTEGGQGPGGEIRPASQLLRRRGGAEALRRARRLEGDLDTILARALALDPARRYGSVRDLAEDVERHLEHRPVRARRPTVAYRLRSFLFRYRLASAAGLVMTLLAVTASWQAWEASRQSRRAEQQTGRARALSRFLIDLFQVADPGQSRGQVVTARELLDAGAERLTAGTEPGPRWLAPNGEQLATQPETRADLLHAIGEVYQNLGLWEPASRSLAQAAELRSRLSGPQAELDRAGTLVQLAHLQRSRGEFDESQALYQQALEIRRRRLPAAHLDLAEVANGLGLLHAARGEAREAADQLGRAIAIARANGEAGRLPLAETLSNLAGVEITLGEAEKAAQLLDEARAIHHQRLGDDHPRTASDLSNLGGLRFSRGDYAGAAALFREAVALRRRLLGPEHPHLAVALSNLSAVLFELGELAEAEAALREALGLQRRLRAEPHADVAHALNNLASLLRERGQAREAAGHFEEALALYRRVFGPRHAMVATCLANLSLAHRDLGDLPAAERLAREALAMRRELLGAEHALVASSLYGLADLAERAGRLGEAMSLHRQALEMRRRLLGADHPALASSLVGLGGVLLEQGQAAEARPLLEEGLAIRKKSLAADHPLVALAESQLGAAWAELGERERARPLLEGGHRTLLARRGPEHPDTLAAARRLARLGTRPAGSGS